MSAGGPRANSISLLYCGTSIQYRTLGTPTGVCDIRDGTITQGEERGSCSRAPDLRQLEVSLPVSRLPRHASAIFKLTRASLIRPKNFEQDLTWLRVGLAMRTSMDINLHRVALLKQARDGLPTWLLRSIIRTWLCGFILDRTLSAQLGKPSSVRGENSVSFYMDLIRQGMQGGKDDVRVASLAVSFLTNLFHTLKRTDNR